MLDVKFYKIPRNKSRGTTITRILEKKWKRNTPTEIQTRKCIIVVSNNVYFAYKCLAISFNRSRVITILKILGNTPLRHRSASYNYTNHINLIS